jgi:type IV pilus assembly protein PilC
VIAISEFFIKYWWLIFGGIGGGCLLLHAGLEAQRKSADGHGPADAQDADFWHAGRKVVIARWTRTLSTMFAAGVPLVEALDSVGGASGNSVFEPWPRKKSSRKSPPAPA